MPWLDIAGVHDADAGSLTFFAINRHAGETMEADLALEGFAAKSVEHTIIRHDDLEARNTRDAPDTVSPDKGNGATLGGKGLTLTLPPHLLLDDPRHALTMISDCRYIPHRPLSELVWCSLGSVKADEPSYSGGD